MSKYNLRELAEKLDIKQAAVRRAAERKYIVAKYNKIDDEESINIAYILKRSPNWYNDRIAKGDFDWPVGIYPKLDALLIKMEYISKTGKPKQRKVTKEKKKILKIKQQTKEARQTKESIGKLKNKNKDLSGTEEQKTLLDEMTEQELREEKLRQEIKWKEGQTKLQDIKEKRLARELISVGMIVKLLNVYIPRYKQNLQNEVKGMVSQVCDDFNVPSDKRAQYLGDLEAVMNLAAENSQQETIEAIDNLSDEDNQ